MLLTVIIVSYNTAELTTQCLDSVLQEINHSKLLNGQTQISLVDNNSSDDSVPRLKEWQRQHPGILQLSANKKNLGFAAANNQAIRDSKTPYVLLLNSDTIIKPKAIEQLLARMDRTHLDETTAHLSSRSGTLDRLGILAATLLNPDGSPQPQGGSFPTLLSLAAHMLMLDDLPLIGQFFPSTQHTGRRATSASNSNLLQKDWVAATAVLVRRETLAETNLLDENIFMYGEDVELCLRARHHHWDVAIDPLAQIIHFGSASSSSARAIQGELMSYLYIWAKHKPEWQLPLAKLLIRAGARLRVFLFDRIVNDPQRAAVYKTVLTQAAFQDHV